MSNTLNAQALPLQAQERAIATAKGSVEGLVHHSDHGNQIRLCRPIHGRLVEAGIDAPTGIEGEYLRQRTGQTLNGLCASELT